MNARPEIAFYAPLKSPDHIVPSGDRTMARLWLKALEQSGFKPSVQSRLRSYEGLGNEQKQEAIRQAALIEAEALVEHHLSHMPADRPKFWFSYHVYYKAPDWIGPIVADALSIPYVIAEGSRAPKQASGPWAVGYQGAEQALDRADLILAMTERDEETLMRFRPGKQRIVKFPPFIDLEEWPNIENSRRVHAPPCFLTVAMMRYGDKLDSFRQLAEALHLIAPPWQIDIVGDGPARSEVEMLFAPFGQAVTMHGEIAERSRLAELYRKADLLLWPAVNEAYGMIFLEAQAFGCPVVGGDHGGVASVIMHGETGLLVKKDDPRAFADTVTKLLTDGDMYDHLSRHALLFVNEKRSIRAAVKQLTALMESILQGNRT